jgi:hypothetical protein
MRLWDQWQNIILSTSDCTGVKATIVTDIEISKAAVIIAYAAVNSRTFLFDSGVCPTLKV